MSLLSALPNYPEFFWLSAVIGVLLIGISKAGFGGGLGILSTPLLALTIPISEAAALLLPILIIADALSVQQYREKIDWSIIKLLLPGAIAGVVLGYLFFTILKNNEPVLKLGLGILVILFLLYQLARKLLAEKIADHAFPPYVGRILSLISGFTSTIAHIGAPPIYVYVLPLKLQKDIYVGTLLLFFFLVNLIKLIPYYFLDLLNVGNLTTVAVLAPVCFIGVWLGKRLNRWLSPIWFTRIVYAMLFCIAIQLMSDYNVFYSWWR